MRLELSGIHVQPSVELERCRQRRMIRTSKWLKLTCVGHSTSTSRWQTSYGALMSIIAATSACSSKDCVYMTVWYGSTTAVATCGQAYRETGLRQLHPFSRLGTLRLWARRRNPSIRTRRVEACSPAPPVSRSRASHLLKKLLPCATLTRFPAPWSTSAATWLRHRVQRTWWPTKKNQKGCSVHAT